MNVEELREYCLNKKGITEEFPFDEETLVFKVMGKIFALVPLERIPLQINLKCAPEKSVGLREKYDSIQPAYHMNKKHWNTVLIEGTFRSDFILGLIDHSYELVVNKLSKKQKEELEKY